MINPFNFTTRAFNQLRLRFDRKARLVKRVMAAKEARKAGPHSYNDHPRLSLILLSFNHRDNVLPILAGLRLTGSDELIVCEDGSVDGSEEVWLRNLTGPNEFLIRSNDIHEIRAYNRAIGMARGEIVCLLQDDDIPPVDGSWVENALALFEQHSKLAILSGHQGYVLNYSSPLAKFEALQIFGFREGPRWIHVREIPFRDSVKEIPFMFVEGVSIGPMFFRREVFEKLGGFDLGFSKPGESGMLVDHEICLRAWLSGWQVGLFGPIPFRKYVGGQGTVLYGRRARKDNMAANIETLKRVYAGKLSHIERTVNELNEKLKLNRDESIATEETLVGIK